MKLNVSYDTIVHRRFVIGKYIHDYRCGCCMSVNDFANKVGISSNALLRIEAGKYSMPFDVFIQILSVLHIEEEFWYSLDNSLPF